MAYCSPQPGRRHNPVDSICRKLQTIQWRGDLEPNSPFQIPKLSSSSFDSPQCSLRRNVEAILKKGALHRDEGERGKERARDQGKGMAMPSSAASQRSSGGPSTPFTPAFNPPMPAYVTYTITSTLGERRGADGSDLRQAKTWQRSCSTPTRQSKDSPYVTFTRGPQPESERPSRSPSLGRTFTPSQETLSYDLNFSSADAGDSTECEPPYPALVVKRLSMGDAGSSITSENRKESMAEISLICEENLLDTIFHACDTQRRGKVYVSHIVDYLRHTTSRSSEDSGLEDLCNMLDPEHKDISIDLDTYHAVMREWIDDCRNNGEEPTDDVTQDSVKLKDSQSAKRSMLLNLTSGSLEAFGGEASRAEFETSELVYCVADLQMSNQKLQEEVRKLKQAVEGMEESNLKLAEENEELRNQARLNQQLAQKEKMLKEEVEEMKATLSCTEEGRARASAHSKDVERENQGLIAKIASLQEENFKVTMEMDDLQRRMAELCDINADLQVQIHSFDAAIGDKEAVILERSRQINELKSAVEEYSSITELLRADKNKLENQIKMIHPDVTGAGLSLSVAFRLNQSSSGSLQTELALAQSPLEAQPGADHLSTTVSFVSPLDETLDREVLLMLQGPSPEYMAQEFKRLLNKLKRDFKEETHSVLSSVRGLLGDDAKPLCSPDTRLQTVQAELDARRADWALSLDQLAQYTDSLEKELIKMASNMRRSRTEILHLSVRMQEQENQKRQLCEELEQLKTPQDSREASCQTPASEEESRDDLDWDEESALQDFLRTELAERNGRELDGRTHRRPDDTAETLTDRGEEKWMAVDTAREGEVRNTSTPLTALSGGVQPGQGPAGGGPDSAICTESEPEVNCQYLQDEAAVPSNAHLKAVAIKRAAVDALPGLSHIGNNHAESNSCSSAQRLNNSNEQDQTDKLSNTPLTTAEMVSPDSISPGPDEAISKSESIQPTSEDHGGEEEKEGKAESSAGVMSHTKSLSQDQSAGRSAAEDSTCLLPVLVEEEETVPDSAAKGQAVATSMEGTEQLTSSRATTLSDGNSPQSRLSVTHDGQSRSAVGGVTSDSSRLEDSAGRKDSLPRSGTNKKELELPRIMEAMEGQKVKEDQIEDSVATEKDSETSVISDTSENFSDSNNLSPSGKEVEVEFQRLALGFKCDMFTLEKRLRLEERSRDLAEENVRREVSSCQGLLQALTPLCEDDNQSTEIIQRLQKNLDILIQSMIRVSSRSEMLGAIHQENRIGKAVEVMIQHVENMRRMYTKEHAELLELRETLMQNERSFGSQTERGGRDDFRGKKQPTSQYYKQSARRVSIAAIPRSGGGNTHFDMSKTQEGSEAEMERLTRRLPCPSPSSSLTSTDPGIAQSLSHSLTSSRAATAVARGGRGVWLWLAMVVVLAGLLALLASLVLQPVVDAAPVGTGDSWMTVQQLLWPYAGLRHNGQPPV